MSNAQQIAEFMITTLRQQAEAEEPHGGAFIGNSENLTAVLIDGRINVAKLAEEIISYLDKVRTDE